VKVTAFPEVARPRRTASLTASVLSSASDTFVHCARSLSLAAGNSSTARLTIYNA
jgi:hypothetical protein